MMCGMCEAHVQDVVRRNIEVKKVKASHMKNNLEIITDKDLTKEEFERIIGQTGYKITSFVRQEAVKKLFGWR